MFMVTFEERDQLLRPIAESGQEAVGSMGDDTPMAVLSRQVRHVSDYFRQQCAQVTNPPIDPLRESIVMSLETCLGREQNVFEQSPEHADRLIISSPVLSNSKMHQIRTLGRKGYEIADIAQERGLTAATIINHLAKLHKEQGLDISVAHPGEEVVEQVRKIYKRLMKRQQTEHFSEEGAIKLRPIVELTNPRMGYDQVRLALLYIE